MAINRTAAQVIISSAAKAYTKATKTGTLNMGILALYNMLAYYAEFTRGKAEYNQEYAFLLDKMNTLKYQNPDILCNYKQQAVTIPTSAVPNTAPTVDDNIIDIGESSFYRFKVADFTVNYADAEQDDYKYLIVYPITAINGILSITSTGDSPITQPTIFNIEGQAFSYEINLYYTRTNTAAFALNDIFNFRVSDDPTNYLYSTTAFMDVYATLAENDDNQPPTIGDNTIYVDNRATTILTLEMFTSQLTPPYNDPEADLIDAIRIDEISTANTGIFYLNGVQILEGDIITREDLAANLFTHEGPNQDSINSDVFNFSARDEGSQIWVQ